ncbi:MAG: Fur family transcriptional regulator [Thermovenabulum sp.]|uniref:Fur family transcriptional regulator n=1 Tax=Thermovenabulum sp. TaxID=3100335 RepID=UPI003C7DA2C7
MGLISSEDLIKKAGLKVTGKRRAIIDALLKSGNMLSAKNIYDRVKKEYPDINFSTVYRNLNLLAKKGILCFVLSENKSMIFSVKLSDEHHHHIVCKNCGSSVAINYCPMEFIEKELKEYGFSAMEHNFIIYGICPECKAKG